MREPGFEVVKHSPNIPLIDAEFDLELQHVDAAVVILTPGYVSTGQAVASEYPALRRAEREKGLPVFTVIASPISARISGSLTIQSTRLVIEKSLAEMGDEERGDALGRLVREVATAIDARRADARDTGPSLHSQQRDLAQNAASVADGDHLDDLPLGADIFPMAPAAEAIVARAGRSAVSTRSLETSTTLLLLALVEAGSEWAEEEWTASWLYRVLGADAVRKVRQRLLQAHDEIDPAPDAGHRVRLSTGAARALNTARDIATRTTGTGTIRTRHLLASLLTDSRGSTGSGALQELELAGFRVSNLRKELFEFVRDGEDDNAAWSRILLGREVRVYRMAGFHADDTHGEDLLGIEKDVLAFATLIAARSVTPPLSIGLFGEWGSGKSFFMRRLRNAVAELAGDAARSGQMQRDLPFYKRIVQIEFNAWHYVEGNLWASLVEHIFRNLKIPGDPPSVSEALQQRLMDGVEFTGKARAQANEEVQRAQREVDAARERVAAAQLEHERQSEALAELAAKEVASDLTVEEVRGAVAPVLERLGASAVGAGVHELLDALSAARALVERGRSVFLPLVRAPEAERRRRAALLLMAMFLGPAVYWLVGAAVRMLGDAAMAQLSAFASGAATLLTAGAAWMRSQVKWSSDRLAELEKAQREVDRRLAEKGAEQTRELRALQERLRLAQADYEAARRSEVESEKRAAEARAKLEESSVARLVASFIEDRAASTDYRKHLGVLALVRSDFETLSGLIEEENWCLSPPGHDDDRYPGKARFETLDQEKARATGRINRIVLYIDDLDRCPPNKVVEVLQAVHLLLAFPLFVVVVGVDARWVKRSLEVRYRELLHGADAKDSAAPVELLIGKATVDDYLEKIFQVPFWLRPMDETHTGRMVRGLLGSSTTSSESATTDAAKAQEPAPGATRAQHAAVEDEPGDSPPRVLVLGGLTRPGRPIAVGGLEVPHEPQAAAQEEPQVNLESLVFQPEELEFMAALAPLLDRSPRALKRFVNVYRLIKAGLAPPEQRVFLAGGGPAPPYRAVLFLLAIDTGLPELADDFFAALRAVNPEPGGGTGEGAATLMGLVEARIEELGAYSEGRLWARVRAWLRPSREAGPRFDAPPAVLAAWEPRVMRYSFRAQG